MSTLPSTTAPAVLSGTMNWEPVRQRLLGSDLNDALKAATELRENIEIVHSTEFPLMLSALLPAFSSILGHRTRPTPDTTSVEHKFRYTILDIISKMPCNDILRPHAPHLVAVAIDILNRDYEENALLASRIIFDLYKVYRSLPQDYVQPYIDFVVTAYRSLPAAIQRCFAVQVVAAVAAAPIVDMPNQQQQQEKESSSATKEKITTEQGATSTAATGTEKSTPTQDTANVGITATAPPASSSTPAQPPSTTTPAQATSNTSLAQPAGSITTPAAETDTSTTNTVPPQPPETSSATNAFTSTTTLTTSMSLTSPPPNSRLSLRSNMSFRVLTECPLMVMLMFQLYPMYVNKNIPVLISVMMEGLALRAPSLQSLGLHLKKMNSEQRRFYFLRARELVAAQAKTLSFLTYLLRSFSSELKAYEDRLANNVVALMTICPREAVSTRKELLVATRHLLNSDFRKGFFKHVDSLLDERVLMGSHHRFSDQSLLRPLGYTTLSDLVQHVRSMLTMSQMSRVVGIFSRVLHDHVGELPMSTQYIAIRTLLSVVDIIYHNKDPNPQIGRDMLVRTLSTMMNKLVALSEPFPAVGSQLRASSCPQDPDAVRDIQSMIRAIVVGHKTILYYIHNYKTQRDNRDQRPLIPVGSNEEVSSAMLRLTSTEVGIVNRYIQGAFGAIKILQPPPGMDHAATASSTTASGSSGEKTLAEQHRDALTYFASAFTALDGYNLRRTLGTQLDLLFGAVVDDSSVMVVPRHLLASNPSTSFEFCSMLLDYLVENMNLMSYPRATDVIFVDPPPTHCAKTAKEYLREQVHRVSQLPAEDDKMLERKSIAILQLFERVLKSLSTFPENEILVRAQLRRIVSFCLKASMENTAGWPDSYCMLLRYVFRSISAGKFEESYKELLPLIPAVLNGLYRIIVVSKDSPAVLHTAIELCLTIPARLSSLLPHMNLLLRIIIPALDSSSGDLVNLGLRTLEFWVDNLNPLFLYPEISKEKTVFSRLMQSLSRHLRPAPYPYGLLTLRLLGKLGGKNREFLREPIEVVETSETGQVTFDIECNWTRLDDSMEDENTPITRLFVPLGRCLCMMKHLASLEHTKVTQEPCGRNEAKICDWSDHQKLWDCNIISEVDFDSYKESVVRDTKHSQAKACFELTQTAIKSNLSELETETESAVWGSEKDQLAEVACTTILFGCMIDSIKNEAFDCFKTCISSLSPSCVCSSLAGIMSEASVDSEAVVLDVLKLMLKADGEVSQIGPEKGVLLDCLVTSLCAAFTCASFSTHPLFHKAILLIVKEADDEWRRKHELKIVNSGFVALKSAPRELSRANVDAASFVIKVCSLLYKVPIGSSSLESDFMWDAWPLDDNKKQNGSIMPENEDTSETESLRPIDEVFRLVIHDMVSMQLITRFTARFILRNIFLAPFDREQNQSFLKERVSPIRRTLFSRSLRLMPLALQVGVTEGLAVIMHESPALFPLTDQHLLAFLSELLKMLSVADGEMSDPTLSGSVVDKNGYVSVSKPEPHIDQHLSHASALFFRRECVVDINGKKVVVPEELPVGIQLRVSAIGLLHSVIRGHSDAFFDAETSSPVGNIRPHVVSLLFRSLISSPLKAVDSAHFALHDVLHLSFVMRTIDGVERSQSRLPKELLQTCIRPVLLNLRDYTRLSVELLRGLSRLLSLLSSWFNKTLGEKLLDHLQKWTEPGKILSQKIWKQGDEPLVAAAVVDIFASLPHASQFVEPLVKTCIKLEATMTAFKTRFVVSPFRVPLARYLNKNPQYAVSFFFQRLKTPMYSELFQQLVDLPESDALRTYLNSKHCSVMILNVCFERPLAIIRSEKSSPSGSNTPLLLHGIPPGVTESDSSGNSSIRAMTIESLELQLQGFRLVSTLMSHDPGYFQEHNDIVRALRWLWRSKGRFLRLQHEDSVPPRYHSESTFLASFLTSYAKSFPNEDIDILFELIRIFLQPSTSDFSFVGHFLAEIVSKVLDVQQKKQVVDRFFALIAGESTEETKVLSIQFLIFPILNEDAASRHDRRAIEPSVIEAENDQGSSDATTSAEVAVINASVIKKFATEVIYRQGVPVGCGERLKVEFLRLLHLFVDSNPKLIETYRKEMVRFCWGLLKSEDASCKGWAYLVVASFIEAFETPSKIVIQVYVALLRSHQQEGKDLVREALDVLVPSLTARLPEDDFRKTVEQTSQLMLEEGNSTPQLAHICQTIINSPDVFYGNRLRFVGYMINSINRLGLLPNCPLENRTLAVDVVELLLDWEKKKGEIEPKIIPDDQVDTVGNFLVRLRVVMAEASDGKQQKVESQYNILETRVIEIFERVLSRWKIAIRPTPFEKATGRQHSNSLLLSCLELFGVMAKTNQCSFFSDHHVLVKNILSSAFAKINEDLKLQYGLEKLIEESKPSDALGPMIMNSLEKVIIEATSEQKKKSSVGRGSLDPQGSSRNRERHSPSSDETAHSTRLLAFALENISKLCRSRKHYLKMVGSSLIGLIIAMTKNHLMDAASKQRHGSASTPWATSPGIKCHTPICGILEEITRMKTRSTSKGSASRLLSVRDSALYGGLNGTNKALAEALMILEDSNLPFLFNTSRKSLLQILTSLLDGSDCVQVLVVTTRMVGKWILSNSIESPVTLKEKLNFLRRIACLGYSGISNDLEGQPLADIVWEIVKRTASSNLPGCESEMGKIVVSTLLHTSQETRENTWRHLCGEGAVSVECFWRLVYADLEGLGSRFWVTSLVEALLLSLSKETREKTDALRTLIHADPVLCVELLQVLLPAAWDNLPSDPVRLKLAGGVEFLLSRSYHAQFMGNRNTLGDERCSNAVRGFLNGFSRVKPVPILDLDLLVSLAESYNCWYEIILLLESQYPAVKSLPFGERMLAAMRHCFRKLDEENAWMGLATYSCKVSRGLRVLSQDVYGMMSEAMNGYTDLLESVDEAQEIEPSDFEMSLWEERWIDINKDLCQLEAVNEYANVAGSPRLQLECAWKKQDWSKVRSLCGSNALLSAIEAGDPVVKMSETLLAVADGKLNDVENLHAQTAQLCLYKWQLLPRLGCSSLSHSSLLHFFHRLVEIRESGQIMVETSNHSNGRTLPDLKNLLNAWRHRLPNDWERLSAWDDVFAWRAHMFTAITSNFHWSEPNTLAALHDRPWTVIRMAKTARKQGMRDVSLLLLNKTAEERAMNVSDAFLKLREQILAYYNLQNDRERHGGLNLINTTNLSFFDENQKSEIFRLKAKFLASLGGKSKANQAYCHSVQVSETHARAWTCWGQLCSSLGAIAERQANEEASGGRERPVSDSQSSAAKVPEYLAQGMGCFLEAVHIDPHEQARIYIPKCLWMLTKDSTKGILRLTLEDRGSTVPAWVWLPWIPQLLTSFYRPEGNAIKKIFGQLVRAYPQAVYYPLRSFYLERRDVERARSQSGHHMASVAVSEVMMSLLRRSHASLWSSLESVLEELIVKFRPSYEEELLSTIIALQERAGAQVGTIEKTNDEESVIAPVRKTLSKICVKFFRPADPSSREDERSIKTAQFKAKYKEAFEKDFNVNAEGTESAEPSFGLEELMEKLKKWKQTLEEHVLTMPVSVSLAETSQALSMFAMGDAPDLWPGSCDPNYSALRKEREKSAEPEAATSQSSTSSSAAAARRAASLAAINVLTAASRDGMGGEYGGGSSYIEVPGQYAPNTSAWADTRPSPELHTKVVKFLPSIEVLRRSDQLVRRIGMVGSDGRIHRFLLQFAVPYWTRTDERTTQTHFVLDKMIRKDFRCMRAQLSVQPQAVIPVAQRLRLIHEDKGRSCFEDVHRANCSARGIDHSELIEQFTDEVKTLMEGVKKNDNESARSEAEKDGKLKLFKKVSSSVGAEPHMLSDYIQRVLKDPELVYNFRRMFAQQWGANCLLQYVFSVTERTPGRVAFIETDGRVLAPDFRIAYNGQGFIEKQPIPFRLTANIVNLIGFSLIEACFSTSIARISSAVRASKSELDPILRILLRDDLVTFYTKSVAKSDAQTQEMEKQLIDRVSRNVGTIHSRFAECSPDDVEKEDSENQSQDPVDKKVRDLIATARNPADLCMMPPSYQGWL